MRTRRIFLNDEGGVFKLTFEPSLDNNEPFPSLDCVWRNFPHPLPINVQWDRQWGVRIKEGDEEKGKRLLIVAALADTEKALVNLSKLIKGESQNEDNDNNGTGRS